MPQNYLGYPVWLIKPTLENNIELSMSVSVSDFGKQFTAFERKKLKDTRQNFEMTFQCNSLQERKEIIDFFNSMYGMYGKFWLPSFKRDFELSRVTTSTQAYVYTSDLMTYDSVIDKYIVNVSKDSSVYPDDTRFSRITNIEQINTTEDRLTLDTIYNNLPTDTYICFMYFARFDTDSLKFDNKENGVSLVTIKFKELSIEECI